MYTFKNIDDYIPERFENMGMLKGKRWYFQLEKVRHGLFKPQRNEFGDKKVFCGNHYGEFIGYMLSQDTGIDACVAELAHLSKYFPNIHKERNNGTPIEKDGCITYSNLRRNERLEHGRLIVERFARECPEEFERLIANDANRTDFSDNIEVIMASIEYRVREIYSNNPELNREQVEEKIKQEKEKMISCIVYDCLYGNNDRHDENWGFRADINGQYITMYSLYDNERVLGLFENKKLIEKALYENNVESMSESLLFSRMKVPGETKRFSTYKDVLKYMLEHYPEETKKYIDRNLKANSVDKVSTLLDECDGLPESYKTFSKRVFSSRREYAKNLIRTKGFPDVYESQR